MRPRVLSVQYTNPAGYPPVEHGVHLLAREGADVRVIGTQRPGDPLVFAPHARVRLELRAFRGAGWRQKWDFGLFIMRVLWVAAAWRPTAVYASDPLACPAGLAIASLLRIPVVYHEHDAPGAPQGRFGRFVAATRRGLARRAVVCVVPSEQRVEAFRASTGRADVLTVWNTPLRSEVAEERPASGVARMAVVYHGSIVPARLPEAVLHALARLPVGVTLDVIGYETVGHQGYPAALAALAARLGLGARVRITGAVSRSALMAGCAAYDVGLALLPTDSEDENERTMIGASNKPFDYMAAGLALVVPDQADWVATFVGPGYALSCDPSSVDHIAMVLQRLWDDPAARRDMGARGQRRIREDWNYDTGFGPLLEFLQGGQRPRQVTC